MRFHSPTTDRRASDPRCPSSVRIIGLPVHVAPSKRYIGAEAESAG